MANWTWWRWLYENEGDQEEKPEISLSLPSGSCITNAEHQESNLERKPAEDTKISN